MIKDGHYISMAEFTKENGQALLESFERDANRVYNTCVSERYKVEKDQRNGVIFEPTLSHINGYLFGPWFMWNLLAAVRPKIGVKPPFIGLYMGTVSDTELKYYDGKYKTYQLESLCRFSVIPAKQKPRDMVSFNSISPAMEFVYNGKNIEAKERTWLQCINGQITLHDKQWTWSDIAMFWMLYNSQTDMGYIIDITDDELTKLIDSAVSLPQYENQHSLLVCFYEIYGYYFENNPHETYDAAFRDTLRRLVKLPFAKKLKSKIDPIIKFLDKKIDAHLPF